MPPPRSELIFDVAVVGLGAVGGATLMQLARRGAKVVGLDRFDPPHRRGSSHGQTRITRQALGEGTQYTPFVLRANAIWEEVERELSAPLLERCGFLYITRDDGGAGHIAGPGFLATTEAAARAFGIAHERLDGREVASRFPQFTGLHGDERAYYEPGGGYLRVEPCIAAQLQLARRGGATVHTGVQVFAVEPQGEGVLLSTSLGRISAGAAVVAAGAWLGGFAGANLRRRLTVTRQVLHWFALADPFAWRPGATPTYVWTYGSRPGDQFYGFPPVAGAVKVAQEDAESVVEPDDLTADSDRDARAEAAIRRHVRGRLTGLADAPPRWESCLYTTTPDRDFMVGTHPRSKAIRLVSACSGHGFKHAAAIGEALASALMEDNTGLDLQPFGTERFSG